MKKNLLLFIEGARLKTLALILVPIALATSWAFYQTGLFNKSLFIFTLLSALFIQIATNFFNDAWDSKETGDHSLRKGPRRLVQSGKSSFSQVQLFAFLSLFLAWVFGLPLLFRGGWPIFCLGLVSSCLSYFYTAGGRLSLLKTGLSEIFCFLFFGPVAVSGSYYLQTLKLDLSLIYLGIPCGFWSLSVLLINHLRDELEDRRAGRKHFATVYGRVHTLFFLTVIQAFIYLFCFFWMGEGLKAGAWSFFVLPFSALLLYFIANNPPGKKYNLYLGICCLLYILFAGAWMAGLFV